MQHELLYAYLDLQVLEEGIFERKHTASVFFIIFLQQKRFLEYLLSNLGFIYVCFLLIKYATSALQNAHTDI